MKIRVYENDVLDSYFNYIGTRFRSENGKSRLDGQVGRPSADFKITEFLNAEFPALI